MDNLHLVSVACNGWHCFSHQKRAQHCVGTLRFWLIVKHLAALRQAVQDEMETRLVGLREDFQASQQQLVQQFAQNQVVTSDLVVLRHAVIPYNVTV